MTEVKDLKKKLLTTLERELETPTDESTFKAAMSTAAKVVKDFQHEADDNDKDLEIQNDRLAAYLNRKTSASTVKN